MVKIYRYDDPDCPHPVKVAAYQGGDEDYIVVGPSSDFVMFEWVARSLANNWSNDFNPDYISTIDLEGVETLVYCIAHA